MSDKPSTRTARSFIAVTGLSLIAIGINLLMTWHHDVQLYGLAEQGALIGCETSESVNCDAVNTSAYSALFGVPIATWGLAAYALLGLVSLSAARGVVAARNIVLWMASLAVGCSAFLFWVSVSELGFVCAWCLRLYAINGIVLVISWFGGGRFVLPERVVAMRTLGKFVLLALIAIGGERAYRGSLLGAAGEIDLSAAESAVAASKGGFIDPKGEAPAFSFSVVTEDRNQATLVVSPDDAWKGNPEATVAVVEFGDFECGYCKRMAAQLSTLYEAYGDRVLFVYKHFPMDPACNNGVNNRKHRYACSAARSAVCAQAQGRFWDFHDLAYKNQHQLKPEHLRGYAKHLDLDLSAYDACLQNRSSASIVVGDAKDGKKLDIHGTPRIYINGKLYRSGHSAMVMARAIELALGADAQSANTRAKEISLAGNRDPAPASQEMSSMVQVGDFSVDTFEAGLDEKGAATSGKHQIPATNMSWFSAKDACEASGKRLCTEAEWVTACQGKGAVDDDGDGQTADDMIEGTSYPYGDYHERGRCWDARPRGKDRLVYTGEMAGCVSVDGAYDLTGNVEEWVGDSPQTAVLLGGNFETTKDHARCFRRNDTYGPGFANHRTGFRCCK
jgi:protein-disulfide isomerase/uncharacterized membrane protein